MDSIPEFKNVKTDGNCENITNCSILQFTELLSRVQQHPHQRSRERWWNSEDRKALQEMKWDTR